LRRPTRPSKRSATWGAKRGTTKRAAWARSRKADAWTLKEIAGDAVRAQRRRHARHQAVELVAEVPGRLPVLGADEREHSGIAAVLEHGDEAQVVAALLLALLEDGQCVALDQ
jgi:hypothetical protein